MTRYLQSDVAAQSLNGRDIDGDRVHIVNLL
jgi:hypothetical protein